MERCRFCNDYLIKGRSILGTACVGNHEHAPWPDFHYTECATSVNGVTGMRIAS